MPVPAYRKDGTPDGALEVPGMPNTAIDLEAFSTTGYMAVKRALKVNKPDGVDRAAVPRMGLRERLTFRWLALPSARAGSSSCERGIDRPLPFPNGTPGSTNGVATINISFTYAARPIQ